MKNHQIPLDNQLLATIILTSDYSFIRATKELVAKILPDETKVLVSQALSDARERLSCELKLSGLREILIYKEHDPFTFICSVEDDIYERLTTALERGWDGDVVYNDSIGEFTMSNAGYLRRNADYNKTPDSLSVIKTAIDEEWAKIISGADHPLKYEQRQLELEAIKRINFLMLSMTTPYNRGRDELIAEYFAAKDAA